MTEKQISASRANGALSRGPKTGEGKKISSQNARKHGLLAEMVVLTDEEIPGFCKLMDRYARQFGPLEGLLGDLLEDLAVARWRIWRKWVWEAQKLDEAGEPGVVVEDARFELATGPKMAALNRYEESASLRPIPQNAG